MAKTLLLADDSVTIQKVVGISFANEDVEILTVDNGDDALIRAREAVPDIILADVVMPGRNGYEVCETLKADAALQHIPILLLTGTFEAFDEERARSAHADGHITKPFEAQALVDKVNQLLARAPAVAPAAAAAPATPLGIGTAAPVESGADLEGAPGTGVADEDGFDFFDDGLESADTNLGVATAEPATTAFELDAGESAFDFAPVAEAGVAHEASTQTRVVAPTTAPPPSDATVALGVPPVGVDLPACEDDWPSSDELDAAFDEDGLSGSHPDLPASAADPADHTTLLHLDSAEDSLDPATDPDLEFDSPATTDDDLLGGFDAPEPVRQAVLDPDEGQDFAVSSSDLGDPLAAPDFSEPTLEPALDAPPFEAPPVATPAPEPAFSMEPPASIEAESVFEAPPETSVSAAEAEFPAIQPEPEDFAAATELAPEPAAPALEAQPSAEPIATGPDLTPMMRERVHESLEKIAWEAFADLPEAIVRQALQRIEEIAWEVIPQMAETLIREEIRRMKGDSE